MDSTYRCFDENGVFIEEEKFKYLVSKEDLPPYNEPLSSKDSLFDFKLRKAYLSLSYPSNWHTAQSDMFFPDLVHQQTWVNGANWLTLTMRRYDTDERYERNKQLTLSPPRDGDNPSSEYHRSIVRINGYEFIKTDNLLPLVGSTTEDGCNNLESVFDYFDPRN